MEDLLSVLCDLDGRVSIRGSQADIAIVQAALESLRQQLAETKKSADFNFEQYQDAGRLLHEECEKTGRLEQQLAEKDAEIQQLRHQVMSSDAQALDHWQKLAAIQAREQQLREAFQTYIDEHEECTDADGWTAMTCSMEAHHVADEAFALPQDTSALSTMIAKAGEVMRERCLNRPRPPYTGYLTDDSIRALPGVTLEDLK